MNRHNCFQHLYSARKLISALVVLWLAATTFPHTAQGRPDGARNTRPLNVASSPQQVDVAGIVVGRDSIGTLEHLYGPGLIVTGAHPQGARIWRSTQGWYIYADGFQNVRYGHVWSYVVEEFWISREAPKGIADHHVPMVSFSRRRSELFGVDMIGKSEATILQALAGRLPPPKRSQGDLIWQVGRTTVILSFMHHQLTDILVHDLMHA